MIININKKGRMQVSASKIKGIVSFKMKICDNLRHLYDEEKSRLTDEILNEQIMTVICFEKQLDKDIGVIKKSLAFVLGLKSKHEFLIFKLKNHQILGSIDFYDSNTLLFTIGTPQTIFQGTDKRKNSKVAKINNMQKQLNFHLTNASLKLGELFEICAYVVPSSGYDKISNNCMHFCHKVMKEAEKQKNGEASIIRNNLKLFIGYDLKQ